LSLSDDYPWALAFVIAIKKWIKKK
jgi:hypothetical protein